MNFYLSAIFCFGVSFLNAQPVEPVQLETEFSVVEIDRNFDRKYRAALRRLQRVYPLALHAKSFISDFEEDIEKVDSRRKKKKLTKEAQEALKDQFLFSIKDLYIKEGKLLMKLIHRETGMTAKEIIKSYRGGMRSAVYSGMAKIWEQDLDSKYEPFGEDWITELVINDIIAGRVEFNWDLAPLSKEEYKVQHEEYKKRQKEYRKKKREIRRKKRREKRKRKSATVEDNGA